MAQQILVFPSYIAILLLTTIVSFIISLLIVTNLWKKGKTVEAMLVINALLQIVTIVILLFR